MKSSGLMSHLARIQNIPSYLPYPFWVWTFFFFRFSDLLVGAPRAFNRDEGRVFVYVNNKNVSRASFLFFLRYIYASVRRSICPSPSIRLCVSLSVCVCLSVWLCVCVQVFVCACFCLSVHSSACFSFCLSIYLSVCPHDCLSLCLSANQFLTPPCPEIIFI